MPLLQTSDKVLLDGGTCQTYVQDVGDATGLWKLVYIYMNMLQNIIILPSISIFLVLAKGALT
jgi:hypothetical protein|eukprot:scaffold5596_cov132-Skeletonema_dohrnii-CCMP3373.AAC.11